jgi:hypothetical protein
LFVATGFLTSLRPQAAHSMYESGYCGPYSPVCMDGEF